MQKKKYSKPVLEVEYYTLETTIAACVSTSSASTSTDSSSAPGQTDESKLGFSTYAVYGGSCSCYYSAGISVANGDGTISSYSG